MVARQLTRKQPAAATVPPLREHTLTTIRAARVVVRTASHGLTTRPASGMKSSGTHGTTHLARLNSGPPIRPKSLLQGLHHERLLY